MKKLSKKGKTIIEVAVLISAVLFSFFFWNSFIIYPVKLFVVLLHESSHCIATLVSGGYVSEIKIDYEVGGYCISKGGNQYLIALSGYLGSLILGGILFISAKYQNYSKHYCLFLAISLLVITIFFIKHLFGIFFSFAFITILVLSPRVLPEYLHSYLVKILGTVSCLYIIIDINEDLFTTQYRRSDAQILAELSGVNAWMWGLLIMIVSVIIFYYLVRFNFSREKT